LHRSIACAPGGVLRQRRVNIEAMSRATLPRTARVTSQRDFARARREGRTVSDGPLRFSLLANGRSVTRLGLAVPKRGSAVARNRIKRVIREAFRLRRAELPGGLDVVVSPRDPELAQDFHAVSRSFDALVARLRS
jgi:ribonuclease P protein component